MTTKPSKIEKIKEDYKKISMSDSVTESEAEIIAKHFVVTHDESNVRDNVKINTAKVEQSGFNNDWWAVSFDSSFKYQRRGMEWYSVHIDKNTGEIKVRGFGPY